jgi:uroporphyrin-III C-methyltransferase
MNIPRLTLIGAGPGDIELITLKGIRAIKSADVILYDALANEELLEYARPDALKVYVGKRLGKYVYTQEEINYKIVTLALEYGNVVRLKGGDPFVFGRGFEEMEYAKAFNIECEVVSGVTSAIAAPASVGIPVTSRGYAESFWVITGTTKKGELSKDIELAAQSSATIIILMGMSKLSEICEVFRSHGKSEMPMAIIQNGTRKNVKSVVGTVATIIEKSIYENISNPAVIVIGEVVSLSEQLAVNSYQLAVNSYQ